MPRITTKDGTRIYYKDWGSGQPVVFSHGWPLNADAWDDQLFFFASNGYRAIAHDRRGHGRSSQPFTGNDMDTYADDLAALVKELDLSNVIHIGHSTGGGEVARYIGRHGTKRVAKAVLVGAVPPGMVKTAKNPDGVPIEAFDQIPSAQRGRIGHEPQARQERGHQHRAQALDSASGDGSIGGFPTREPSAHGRDHEHAVQYGLPQ